MAVEAVAQFFQRHAAADILAASITQPEPIDIEDIDLVGKRDRGNQRESSAAGRSFGASA